MEEKSITVQLQEWEAGKYNSPDFATQCEAGWYDWFCRESALKNKTDKLYKKLRRIKNSKKFDNDKTYVFFKNNCPMYGSLYDDFRICDRETGDVIFTIIPSSGHRSEKGKAGVWGRENNFNGPLVEGTWSDVVKFFNN